MELLEALEIGSVSGHDCYVDQITEAPPSLDMLEGTMINVDELDFLARSLDRYTDEELAEFQCMTATREHWDMSTLINLSFSCEQASVITDFSKLEEAGRSHYLTMHGGGVPVEEYNQLNGVCIARIHFVSDVKESDPFGLFSGLFRSRDKPVNRTAGSSYAFYLGGSSSGKIVTERSTMQMTAVYRKADSSFCFL